jgi:hypothetical protein
MGLGCGDIPHPLFELWSDIGLEVAALSFLG